MRKLVKRKRVYGIVKSDHRSLSLLPVIYGYLEAPHSESSVTEHKSDAGLEITVVYNGSKTRVLRGVSTAVVYEVFENSRRNERRHRKRRFGKFEIFIEHLDAHSVHIERIAFYAVFDERIGRRFHKILGVFRIEHVIYLVVLSRRVVVGFGAANVLKRIRRQKLFSLRRRTRRERARRAERKYNRQYCY